MRQLRKISVFLCNYISSTLGVGEHEKRVCL